MYSKILVSSLRRVWGAGREKGQTRGPTLAEIVAHDALVGHVRADAFKVEARAAQGRGEPRAAAADEKKLGFGHILQEPRVVVRTAIRLDVAGVDQARVPGAGAGRKLGGV